MTGWDGRGLPPSAQARMQRFAADGVRGSFLSVPSALSLRSVGFETVGEVMGASSVQITVAGYGCGAYMGQPPMDLRVHGSDSQWAGYGPYVHAVRGACQQAIERMLVEAKALGADGVVGATFTTQSLSGAWENYEFTVVGTAVRANTRSRPAKVFCTDLPGTDVAKLMMSGWVPVSLVFAMEIAVRHDDYTTQMQTNPFNMSNVEVPAFSELMRFARAAVRSQLATDVKYSGADGAVVSDLQVAVHHRNCDHLAEARLLGTTVAAFDRRRMAEATPLPILPVARPTSGRF